MRNCPGCGEENPEGARFCLACGQQLDPDSIGPHEVRKTITVLFTDLVESVGLGERLDPESLRRVIGDFFDEMKAVIERHGGSVAQLSGDAVMAAFGMPVVHEDDALRAVKAAIEMREALAALNARLRDTRGVVLSARTGINTGEVLIDETPPGMPIVVGDSVNVAARLEHAARAGEVLVGDATYRLVRDAVRAEALAPLSLKGKEHSVQAYRVISFLPGAPGRMRRLESPLVGRQRERSLIRHAYDRVREESRFHLVTILGAAGVGKSRLLLDLIDSVRDEAVVVSGRCLPYGEGITFWPLVEIVQEAAGIKDEDSQSEARDKISSLLAGAKEAEVITATVAQVIGLAEPTASTEQIFWAVRKFLEALAQGASAVVAVFEDIHWGEPTFLDLVEHVAEWTRDVPVLLVCIARPELLENRPTWAGGKLNSTSLLLESLPQTDSEALLTNLLGSDELSDRAREHIMEAAEGNPLFLEEMISMLIDDGLLVRDEGRWTPARDLSDISIPDSIQTILTARLDRLTRGERRAIERAAVMGKVFSARAVAELSPPDERDAVPADLLELARKELIRTDPSSFAGEEVYSFRHILVRDAAYGEIPKEVRAALHERYAEWLIATLAERAAEYDEIVGYHLEQAFRYRTEIERTPELEELGLRSSERLVAAGRRAFARGDAPAAVSLLTRSMTLVPEESLRRLELLPDLGMAQGDSGDFSSAERMLKEAIEAAASSGNRLVEAHSRLLLCSITTETSPEGSFQDARQEAERAIEVFEDYGDDIGLSRSWHLLGYVNNTLGRLLEGRESLEKAIEHARRAGSLPAESTARGLLVLTMAFGPTPVPELVTRVGENLRWATENGDRFTEARALGALAWGHAMLGEFSRARALVAADLEILHDLGSQLRIAWAAFESSTVELLAGNPTEAERQLRSAHDTLEKMGEVGTRSTIAAMLAEALCALERYEEAETYTRVSEEAAASDDLISQIRWRTARTRTLHAAGDSEAAERVGRDAVERAAATDFLDSHGNALTALGEVMRDEGRSDEARSLFEEALTLYGRKGNTVSAGRAETVLKELLD